MFVLTAIISIIYLLFVAWYLRGLKTAAAKDPQPESSNQKDFSIIIAAHNEESVIGETLRNLVSQNYPDDKFEIIIAADRCTDRTAEIAEELAGSYPNIYVEKIVDLPAEYAPKKNALRRGIQKARFDHYILMDADCQAGPEYLNTFNRYFSNGTEVMLNFPKVRLKGSLLHRYLLPERLLAWGIAAAGVGNGRPFLAFGGSWGYSKNIFQAAGGFGEISRSLSGDDDLLVYRMGRLSSQISVCSDPDGWVQTDLPATLQEFIIQRRRHHSAGKYYAAGVQLGYAAYHGSNFLLWILPLFYFPALIFLAGKFVADFFSLKFTARVFREEIRPQHFILFEAGFLLHNLLIAPLGFLGKIRWK